MYARKRHNHKVAIMMGMGVSLLLFISACALLNAPLQGRKALAATTCSQLSLLGIEIVIFSDEVEDNSTGSAAIPAR